MKKAVTLLFAFVITFSLSIPSASAAETLNQLLAKAEANRAAYNKAKNEKSLTQSQRDEAIKQKEQCENEIKNITAELEKMEKEVQELQKNIDIKDKEIKNLMKFVQISNGDSNYLEYAFGASDFTDFIYRVSVAEELTNHNNELIEEYNATVKKLENKQKELTTKQSELTKKQQELTELEVKLNAQIETLQEGMLTKDREYKTTIDLINSMKSMGCQGSDTLQQCLNRNRPMSANGTYMPIARGYVTSDYGSRSLDYHTGIDFSNGVYGDNVYPIASGQVMLVQSPGSYTENGRNCGNYIVYVKHNINGHIYITSYWHLASPSVSKGQMVTENTVIGKMGGLHSVDQCAYGVHVHLNLFDGNTWNISLPNSGRINPRKIMPQIPKQGVYFSNR